MTKPLHGIAFTQGFLTQAKAEGMTAAEVENLVETLSLNPEAGELIVSSGGCRKVRLAGRGKGKSGGYRVVTYFAHVEMPVYVIAVLSKGSRENFTPAEVAAMAKASAVILALNRRRAAG